MVTKIKKILQPLSNERSVYIVHFNYGSVDVEEYRESTPIEHLVDTVRALKDTVEALEFTIAQSQKGHEHENI